MKKDSKGKAPDSKIKTSKNSALLISQKEKIRKRMRIAAVGAAAGVIFVEWWLCRLGGQRFSERFFDGYTGRSILGVLIVSAGCFIISTCKALQADLCTDPMHPNRYAHSSGLYGTAKLLKPWEYRARAQIRPIDKCVGRIWGQLGKDGTECIDSYQDPENPEMHANEHAFAQAPSGTGKSYVIGYNYAYQSIKMGHSLVITDPKGELYRDLCALFREHGYKTRRLNFIDPGYSDGWDCMKSLYYGIDDIRKIQENVNAFATSIAINIADNPNGIYLNGPKMLLECLTLRLVLDDTIDDGKKTIKQLYSWLCDPAGAKLLDSLFDERTVPQRARPCLGPYYQFINSSPNLSGNLKLNLSSGIDILNTESVADILSTDDMNLKTLGTERCVYFVQFPVPSAQYVFPISLFFSSVFSTLMNIANKEDNKKLPVEVDFLLDEFAQIGVIPKFGDLMSVIRSYGMNVLMIVQTMEQFAHRYPNERQTILSACATMLILGANDEQSAKEVSERLGTLTVEVQSETRKGTRKALGISNSPTDKSSFGVGKAPLLSPSEVMEFPPNQILIIFQGMKPIWANTVPHVLHPYSKGVRKTYDKDEPQFYDIVEKRKREHDEEKRIRKYWASHEIEPQPLSIRDAPYATEPTIMSDILDIVSEDCKNLRDRHKHNRAEEETDAETDEKSEIRMSIPDDKKENDGSRFENDIEAEAGGMNFVWDEDDYLAVTPGQQTAQRLKTNELDEQNETAAPSKQAVHEPVSHRVQEDTKGSIYQRKTDPRSPESRHTGSQSISQPPRNKGIGMQQK